MASNRRFWDEWAEIHVSSSGYDLACVRSGGSRLPTYEIEEVGPVDGKSLLHLQCHIGADSIAWARRGARVTGVDYSPRAIEIASELAAETGVPARFVCADVLELPAVLTGTFDIVYTSRGVLHWLPDLDQWARVVAQFLTPGGVFYVTDIHPITEVLDDTATELRVSRPYFPRPEPVAYPTQRAPADAGISISTDVKYQWLHSTGELITAVARAGLAIEFFHEFP